MSFSPITTATSQISPFFPNIVEFMQSTPVIALILEGDEVVGKVRDMLGANEFERS